MTKQIINVGSGEQVGDGESIRIAFIKTNENFTELYDNFASISSDVSTLSDVAFSGSYTDLLNTPTVVGASDRLVNENKQVILGANGTLTVPSPTSNQFATVFSAANYVPTLGKPTLTLTDTPWALNGQYVYAQNGETQLALDNMWPTLNNPGYTSGDTFTFDSTVHGIADFVLTIQLNDVVQAGPAGWTANVAASEPPVYASTIKSLGAVKLTASNSSWIFGTDGKLHYPDGSFSNTAFVGQATSAETLVNENNATITTGPLFGTQYIWNFNTNGQLTLPGGSKVAVTGSNVDLVAGVSGWSQLASNNSNNSMTVDDTNAYITTNYTGTPYQWTFDSDGQLTLPGGARVAVTESSAGLVAGVNGWSELASNNSNNSMYVDDTNAYIITNYTGTPYSWTFGEDGILTLPGNIVKLEVDDDEAAGGLVVSVDTGVPEYTSLYKFGRSGQFTSRAISVTDTNGVRVGGLTGDGLGPILGATIGKEVWVSTNGMHLWRFTADRNFVLPPNGDILDSNGTSVIANTGELVGTGVTGVGTALTINDDGNGGLVGWGPQALAVAYNSEIMSTYTAGSTITWQDGSTATITQIDNYPEYHDIFWDTPKSGTLFPITLKTSDYVEAVPFTARITASDKEWAFVDDGKLTLPVGSVISETASTISIAPPTAAAGQSLVIRPTAALWSVNSSGFISYGNPITISVTLSSFPYFGTINYEITGPGVTEQSLGRPITGKLTFAGIPSIDTQTVTWTIPANSDITEFTFTITSVDGTLSTDIQIENDPALYYSFEFNALPIGYSVTVTNDNITNLEFSHVHLVAGDPATVDLYLGDDDQFVKIEKNGGNVVVGTNANTKNWTFAQNGSLTLPNAGIVRTGADIPQVGSTRTIVTDSNEGTGAGTPNVVDVAYDNTIIPTYYYSGGGNPVFTDSTITFANGDVRTITSIVATGGYIEITYSGITTTSSPEFPIILKTGNYVAATTAPEWTFGTDGSITFPDATVQTTAWAGGRVVTAPASSTGSAGDKQGDLAFDGSYMYYCTQDFASEPYSTTIVATYSGFNPDIVKGSIPQPQAGWEFVHNGTTYTLASNAVENNPGEWNCELTTSISVTADDAVALSPASSADIWKRVAWSADTW